MSEDSYTGPERRSHPRLSLAYPIQIDVEQPGGAPRRVSGTTIDVSLSGLVARIDGPIPEGARCEVHFQQAAGRVHPRKVTGKARQAGKWREEDFNVSIKFDEPLDTLKQPGEL